MRVWPRVMMQFGALIATFLIAPYSAASCSVGAGFQSLIHRGLPSPRIMNEILAAGAFIADVELYPTDARHLTTDGVAGRVIRMWMGETIDNFVVRERFLSSCDASFQNGTRGWFVGMVHSTQGGRSVVVPMRAFRGVREEWNLPDEFDVNIWLRLDFDLDGDNGQH